jgi:hypothetical protein
MSISSEFTKNQATELKNLITPCYIVDAGQSPVSTGVNVTVSSPLIIADDTVIVSHRVSAGTPANGVSEGVVITPGVGFIIATVGNSVPAIFNYQVIRNFT